VGLPDDELHRRIEVHRGVYGRYRDVIPNERTLYHLVPARWFNAQLPIGTGRDGYVTEDFHVLGGIEAFHSLEKLLAHANEQLAEQTGYFYVLQLDFDDASTVPRTDARSRETDTSFTFEGQKKPGETRASSAPADEISSVSDSDSDVSAKSSTSSFVFVREDETSGVTLVRAAVDVDAIQRVYVASREADASTRGKFVNVSPP
jgi:zinc finger HIT domain-containing protein 1